MMTHQYENHIHLRLSCPGKRLSGQSGDSRILLCVQNADLIKSSRRNGDTSIQGCRHGFVWSLGCIIIWAARDRSVVSYIHLASPQKCLRSQCPTGVTIRVSILCVCVWDSRTQIQKADIKQNESRKKQNKAGKSRMKAEKSRIKQEKTDYTSHTQIVATSKPCPHSYDWL